MKNVYVLHGCCDQNEFEDVNIPSGSNFHWIPWLQKQLIVKGYNCQTPEMPTPYKPDYNIWAGIFETYPIDSDTVLVGHSCGCGFLLRYLRDNNHIKIKKMILIAPWLDINHSLGGFLNFDLQSALFDRVEELHIFYSKDEKVDGVKETVELIKNTYPNIIYHEFENHGHFCLGQMHTCEFPDLLSVI